MLRENVRILPTQVKGVHSAMGKEDACRIFDLPPDRVGDVSYLSLFRLYYTGGVYQIVVLGDKDTALGK